jgi:hypothetical protein
VIIAVHLVLLFILSVELRLLIGFIWYMHGTFTRDAYEDKWKILGFGYHIKETKNEIFFKLGFFK